MLFSTERSMAYSILLLYRVGRERRLSKCPQLAIAYQEEMEKMVNNGYARILGRKELPEYKGPIHYICHHEMLKPDSDSTPCRIVFNDRKIFMGTSLTITGPRALT